MVWEGSLKSHFERNIDFLDLELDFGGLLDLEMVPKVIYGSHRDAHLGYWQQFWILLISFIFREPPGVETPCPGEGNGVVPGSL